MIVRKKQILFFSLLLFSSPIFGSTAKIDSLLTEVELIQEDIKKIPVLLEISFEFRYQSPQKAIHYAQMAQELIQITGNVEYEVQALRQIGFGYFAQWELDTALIIFQSAYDKAILLDKPADIPPVLNGIASVHLQKGAYQQAIEKYHQALEHLEEAKDERLHSLVLNNIGIIHWQEGRPEQAITYFKSSLAIERRRNNPTGITMALNNIGLQYEALKNWKEALKSYEEAYVIAKSQADKLNQNEILVNIGGVHREQGKIELAYDYYQQAYALAEETKNRGVMNRILKDLAIIEQSKGNLNTAINYAQTGLELATVIDDIQGMTSNLETLINCHLDLEDYKTAFTYKKEYHLLRDSIYNTKKSEQILELSTKYESEQKDIENQFLKEQQAKDQAIINQQKTTSLLTVLVLMLMTLTAVVLYQKNQNKIRYSQVLENKVSERTAELQSSNEELKKSNTELEQFAYIASHDLKQPLVNITSFSNLLNNKIPDELKKTLNIEKPIQFILTNTTKMNRIIEGVLEYSNLRENQFLVEEVAVKEVVNKVLEELSFTLTNRKVQLNIEDLPIVKANASMLFTVVKNLIENAIQFNKNEQPIITIKGSKKGAMGEITIMDNGIGIAPEYFTKIFVMFQKLHNRVDYNDTGIGLSICKKVIEKMGGTIWVESEVGKGSQFIFSLPIAQN